MGAWPAAGTGGQWSLTALCLGFGRCLVSDRSYANGSVGHTFLGLGKPHGKVSAKPGETRRYSPTGAVFFRWNLPIFSRHMCLHFFKFILEFNRCFLRYFRRQRDIYRDFVILYWSSISKMLIKIEVVLHVYCVSKKARRKTLLTLRRSGPANPMALVPSSSTLL